MSRKDGKPEDADISIDLMRELFIYNPSTGEIRNKVRRSSNAREGDLAGTITDRGYIQIHIKERMVFAHRLAWALHYGKWPNQYIDHINEVKTDNRIANLRDIDFKSNMQNVSALSARNSSGVRGVYWDKQHSAWRVTIAVNGGKKSIGRFRDIRLAEQAYLSAKREFHGGFAK